MGGGKNLFSCLFAGAQRAASDSAWPIRQSAVRRRHESSDRDRESWRVVSR